MERVAHSFNNHDGIRSSSHCLFGASAIEHLLLLNIYCSFTDVPVKACSSLDDFDVIDGGGALLTYLHTSANRCCSFLEPLLSVGNSTVHWANVVHSFVTSRVDYCNGLLAAAPVKQMDQLQRVLNAVARLLLRVPRSDFNLRVKVRDQLHWLRIPERVTFKLCTTVYKCFHWMASGYLNELCIAVCTDAYRSHLRSADETKLKVPRHKLTMYGPRAFSIAGPTEWNFLPCHLRDEKLTLEQFTRGLKTHLFCVLYNL